MTSPLPEGEILAQAAAALKKGGVIIFPTEGIYGISCNCSDTDALRRVISLKQRAEHKGLIVVADSVQRIEGLVYLDRLCDQIKNNLGSYWPGHNTILVPAREKVPHLLCGDSGSLAVRITNFRPLADLVGLCGFPLVSTSANLSGGQEVSTPEGLDDVFSGSVDFIARLPCGGSGVSSTIIDGTSGMVLREGKI